MQFAAVVPGHGAAPGAADGGDAVPDAMATTAAAADAPLLAWLDGHVRAFGFGVLRGAPVATYAARVERLVVNGAEVTLHRPAVAIIDTGTTGASVSDGLWDSGLLPPVWRDARLELRTERGALCALEASVRRRRKPAPGIPPPRVDLDAAEFDEFPLIVSPVHVPWFDPGFGEMECADGEPFQCNGLPLGRRRSLLEQLRTRLADGLGDAPHVIFVGLSFFWQRELTIDIDEGRMTIV